MKRRRTEQVSKEVVYQTVCDRCGRVAGADPGGWHSFSTHHNDWGNDSIDSWDEYDVCSWDCYVTVVRRVVDDYGDPRNPTLEVDGKDLPFLRNMLENSPASREERQDG